MEIVCHTHPHVWTRGHILRTNQDTACITTHNHPLVASFLHLHAVFCTLLCIQSQRNVSITTVIHQAFPAAFNLQSLEAYQEILPGNDHSH